MKILPEHLGFDFDGVIADIGEAFLRLACNDHGYCGYNLEDICDFHVERCTKIPEEVVSRIFLDILEDSLATGLTPMPEAIATLEEMSTTFTPTIITARTLEKPVIRWFQHYLSAEASAKIDIVAMEDHDNKVAFLKQKKISYFIDDRGETCRQVAEAGLSPILFRQPWNRNYTNFFTVHNWQDIRKLLPTPQYASLN